MVATVLALVPDYGVYLIFGAVFLACLAVPVPASVLVLTSGSLVASGDLSLAAVLTSALLAYVAGDQIAFLLASRIGARVLGVFERSERAAPVVDRSRSLLKRHGSLAVFLSHTVLSPTCPYISYLSGAGGLTWRSFTLAAVPGALVWTAV
jgi:membrane protein DedA with SNARE-associated domain